MNSAPLITIDGPSASGKSSVSRLVAKNLGCPWVSTGAFYRGLSLAALDRGLGVGDEKSLVELARSEEWKIEMTPQDTLVFISAKDRSSEISGEEVGALASGISQISDVRSALLDRQRRCYDPKIGLVAEGRDCGTVVFPHAETKIYLTASPALRALRRSEEEETTQEKTLEMQKLRDQQDTQRKVAPLKQADGALQIDSSFLSLEEVVQEVLKFHVNTQK